MAAKNDNVLAANKSEIERLRSEPNHSFNDLIERIADTQLQPAYLLSAPATRFCGEGPNEGHAAAGV
jgi:hypothetical protein